MIVSIVIPVYNAEKYLKETVDSALNQTYPDIEVIIVNDGSTDGSLEILKQYGDRVKVFSKKNGGTASALNAGIKLMKGEWFKWLSADDVLMPNAVSELMSEAKKLNDKKVILVSDYCTIDSKSKFIEKIIHSECNHLSKFDRNVVLLDHFIGNGTTCLIHKTAFDQYGMFDEEIKFPLDYELWLRYCLLFKFNLHFVPKILAKYRIHEKQETKKLSKKESLKEDDIIRKVILEKLDLVEREKYEKALSEMPQITLKRIKRKLKRTFKKIIRKYRI